jgi:hypothetical protein
MQKIASKLIPISLGLMASFGTASQIIAQGVPIDRTVLPIPQPIYPPVTELDARDRLRLSGTNCRHADGNDKAAAL